jgi:hypothetical protein
MFQIRIDGDLAFEARGKQRRMGQREGQGVGTPYA